MKINRFYIVSHEELSKLLWRKKKQQQRIVNPILQVVGRADRGHKLVLHVLLKCIK